MPMWLAIVLIIVAIAAGLAVGVYLGIQRRKQVAEKAIGSAETEANRIVSEAIKSAEAKKKEFLLEGKDELHRLRNENEKEISDRRKEVQRQERRIQQKEETLDRKMDNLEKKENNRLRKVSLKCLREFQVILLTKLRITYYNSLIQNLTTKSL